MEKLAYRQYGDQLTYSGNRFESRFEIYQLFRQS